MQGSEALARRHNMVRTLLSNRRLPTAGWDDATIEMFLQVRTANIPDVPPVRRCRRIRWCG